MINGLFFNLNEKITVLVFRRLILSLLFIVFFSFNNIDAQEYWSKADKEIMQFQNLKERKDWHYLTLDNEKLRSSLFNKKSLEILLAANLLLAKIIKPDVSLSNLWTIYSGFPNMLS